MSSTRLEATPYDGEVSGLVTFWFDDAWRSQYFEGYRQLRQAGYRGALAVPTELIGYPAYMTWPQVIHVQDSGWEVSAHSRVHECNISSLSYEELENEIVGSKIDLAKHNLYDQIYVLPCGSLDERVIQLVKSNFAAMRTTESGINKIPVADLYAVKAHTLNATTTLDEVAAWIKEAEETKGWLNLMFHAVTDEPGPQVDEYTVSPKFLAAVIRMVTESDLNVVIPSEVLAISAEQWQVE